MVWLILGGIALAVACVGIWAATRRPHNAPLGHGGQHDLVRSGLAALAAAIALIAAVYSNADQTIEFRFIIGFCALAGLSSALLSALPWRAHWTDTRRLVAGVLAAVWVAVGLGLSPFALAGSACGCTDTGPYYNPPMLLGLDARGWIVATVLVGPVLLAAAAAHLRSAAPAGDEPATLREGR